MQAGTKSQGKTVITARVKRAGSDEWEDLGVLTRSPWWKRAWKRLKGGT